MLIRGPIWMMVPLTVHNMQSAMPPPPGTAPAPPDNKPVLSLAELSQSLKRMVESAYDRIQVKAEVSQPKSYPSGHLYFTLKDGDSTLDAVCWRSVVGRLTTRPEEGLEVVVTGKLTTYPGRSKYQIVVQDVELAGEGALLKQLEERRRRLAAEGLFDDNRKQLLPGMPQTIGVVTSPRGAVIRDILHRLRERYPVRVLVWPVLVQGQGAAEEISAAIRGFDALLGKARPPVPVPDVVIVARGGGSTEDLMAFNDELVVRAAAECRLPLVSGVGHETDTTLIDHAADVRAPTPTAAAEFATPVAADIQARINDIESRMLRRLEDKFDQAASGIHNLSRALSDPGMLLESKGQRLDLAVADMDRRMDSILAGRSERFGRVAGKLRTPSQQLAEVSERFKAAVQRMESSIEMRLERLAGRFGQAARLLEVSSFQSVLERGFALVTGPDGGVMRSAGQHAAGTGVTLRFGDGSRVATLGNTGTSAGGSTNSSAKSTGDSG